MNRKNNSKMELVDFNGMLKRVKRIKQRKSGMYRKRKRKGVEIRKYDN
jgi:hypothetical protein